MTTGKVSHINGVVTTLSHTLIVIMIIGLMDHETNGDSINGLIDYHCDVVQWPSYEIVPMRMIRSLNWNPEPSLSC